MHTYDFMQPLEVQEVTFCLINGRFRLYAMHVNRTPNSFLFSRPLNKFYLFFSLLYRSN